MLCLGWFTSVFKPVFVVEQLENFVALRFLMQRIFFHQTVVAFSNFLARDLHNTLDVFCSTHSWRLQLCHLHKLYQISHTFFVLQHISFSFARDRITFYFNARSLSDTTLLVC